MAKVMKKLNPFNRNSTSGVKTKEAIPIDSPTEQEQESNNGGELRGEQINRRRLSISKSGRYKENNKRRSALHQDDDIDKENRCTDYIMSEKDKKNWENRNKQEAISNNYNSNNNLNISNSNNSRNVSSLSRYSSLSNYDTVSSLDGHAVAEEIECLAKSLTMENSRITNTDL